MATVYERPTIRVCRHRGFGLRRFSALFCFAFTGTIAALVTFVVLIVRFCMETFVERGLPWNNAYLQDMVDYVTISITLLVVTVPEGLPLAVVLALAYSIKVQCIFQDFEFEEGDIDRVLGVNIY